MKFGFMFAVLLSAFVTVLPTSAQKIDAAPDGRHVTTFTTAQEEAIGQFLKAHPTLLQANCTTLGLTPSACAESYEDWHQTVEREKGTPQSPYAAWGNYSHHQSPDLVIPFFSRKRVNNWGWRRWNIVVFEAVGPDVYRPTIAVTDSWGVCFDGILYHPARKRVEFWCKSMGGNIRWNGTSFVGKIEKGD